MKPLPSILPVAFIFGFLATAPADDRPNFLVIIADDLCWALR